MRNCQSHLSSQLHINFIVLSTVYIPYLPCGILTRKSFQFLGRRSQIIDQGICPWTPLGQSPQTPKYPLPLPPYCPTYGVWIDFAITQSVIMCTKIILWSVVWYGATGVEILSAQCFSIATNQLVPDSNCDLVKPAPISRPCKRLRCRAVSVVCCNVFLFFDEPNCLQDGAQHLVARDSLLSLAEEMI